MATKKPITADHISHLLAAKHKDDLFVAECKNGQSYGHNLLRIDAWVMLRTWSPPTTIGYEIKVNRQDFERDQKWIGYTDYCHQFYFVCPAGLIKSHELPKGVGLIWTTLNGERLQTKVRADRRNPEPLKAIELMRYVLMARSVIVPNMHHANFPETYGIGTEDDRIERMKQAVKEANSKKELAYFVRGHIRQIADDLKVKENYIARREGSVKSFSDRLKKLGIIWDPEDNSWHELERVRSEIDRLFKQVDGQLLNEMGYVASRLKQVSDQIKELRKDE